MRKMVSILTLTLFCFGLSACSKEALTKNAVPVPKQLLPAPEQMDGLTPNERTAIRQQKGILEEIMKLLAREALLRPHDLAACAREMFAMRATDKCRDRFTNYLSPEEVKEFDVQMTGEFGGVGMRLEVKDKKIVVIPMPGTPAERAGVKSGDVILSVDGKKPKDAEEAMLLVRGKTGTTVKITFYRESTKQELEVTLVREVIKIQSVKWRISKTDPKVGIIQIIHFDRQVPRDFFAAANELMAKGCKALVIDLRNNPGGLLHSAQIPLTFFMRPEDTMLTIRNRTNEEIADSHNFPPREANDFRRMRTVILINGGSASASEIFAGTMKDWGYPVIGEKSYGKGVGQALYTLSDGSRLMLTTFEFLVGNGRVAIRDKGVTPTIEVKQPEKKDRKTKRDELDERDDLQLQKALEVLAVCGKKDATPAIKCTRD